MRSWKIAFAITAVAVIVAIAFVVLWRGVGSTAGAATPSPASFAMPVPVTKIVKKDSPIYLNYSARTESIRNIALQAKVPGYIRQQHVPDGTDVKEGDLLYTIDPRDFQAALEQAGEGALVGFVEIFGPLLQDQPPSQTLLGVVQNHEQHVSAPESCRSG